MKVEEFWNKYINNDILEIFDDACELFSNELPDHFIEEYDVEEVLLEVRGHQEDEKNFDNVLKFTEIIKNNQPELYQNIFQYYDDFLIDYYCFKQDAEQVKKAFVNFIENPLADFDTYLTQLNRALFYQHTEILEQSVNEESYRLIQNADKLIGGAEFDLAFIKMYTTLQNVFESKGKNPSISSFIAKMEGYDFEFKDSFTSSIETGLFKPTLDADNINDILKKDKEEAFTIIRSSFLRFMHSKGMPFYVSAKITDQLLSYWHEENKTAKTTDAFFTIETTSFGEFINGLSGDFYTSNESESIAILWGSVHFYEFLYKHNYISHETFDIFLDTSRVLKGQYIVRYLPDLWKSDFIHLWAKPECISETEFVQEQRIFNKSLLLKNKHFKNLKNNISAELSEIGDLADHIIEASHYNPKPDMSLLDKLFLPENREPHYFKEGIQTPFLREEKKVGRNEPCPCGSGKKYKKCCG